MKTIEVITFDGCGTAKQLIADLEGLQEKENFNLQVKVVPSADRAGEMRLYGSPTVYINGHEYQRDENSTPGFY